MGNFGMASYLLERALQQQQTLQMVNDLVRMDREATSDAGKSKRDAVMSQQTAPPSTSRSISDAVAEIGSDLKSGRVDDAIVSASEAVSQFVSPIIASA